MTSSRAPSWSYEEILASIRVLSDQSIQDMLDGATRTADIYRRIRQFYKELKDGHERSAFNWDKWCSNFSCDIVTSRRHQHDCMNLSVLCYIIV